MKRKSSILTLILLVVLFALYQLNACSSAAGSRDNEGYTELSQLEGKKIGIQVGTGCDDTAFKKLKQAEIIQYSTKYDLINALFSGRIDAFIMDEPMIEYLSRTNPQLTYIADPLDVFDYAYMFSERPDSKQLCARMSAFIKKLKEDGTLAQLEKKWYETDDGPKTMPDITALSAENGVLKMATDPTSAPMEYISTDQSSSLGIQGIQADIIGYDIEIAILFCEEYGYGLEISTVSADALLAAVGSGAVDFAGSYICVMPERKEAVLYSEPNFSCNSVMCVLDPQSQKAETSIITRFFEKFHSTFIRENRWLLFVQGILTTMLITVLSVIFGTAAGYFMYRFSRYGSPLLHKLVKWLVWLVEGIPLVVLLMILYYMVFKALPVSGIIIGIFCFAPSFAATVYDLLMMGTGTVSKGQYEAAYSLGYREIETFHRIILPQALPVMLPSFNGAVKELLKGTSIVGYIAVQDLTMMGDIIRGRTYDAVFPLAAVAIIYFLLEMLTDAVLKRIEDAYDPRKSGGSPLLKGVNRHD